MTEESKDLSKTTASAVPAQTSKPQRGFEEGVEKEDIIIPRVKLLQPLSPEVVEEKTGSAGDIINSLTKEVLSSEFIPVFKFTNWTRFNPRTKDARGFDAKFAPGDMIWTCADPLDPRVVEEGKWDGDLPPLATKFLNFFCMFKGSPMPLILSFAKTSAKCGKQLLSLAKFAGCDMFGRSYKLGTKMIAGEKGTYYIFTVAPDQASTPEQYAAGEKCWNEFSQKEIKTDPLEDESEPFNDQF